MPEIIWIYGGIVISAFVVAFALLTLLVWPLNGR